MEADRTAMIGGPGEPGSVLAEDCPNCGINIPGGDDFCSRCGYQRGTWAGVNGASDGAAQVPAAVMEGAPVRPSTGPAMWTLSAPGGVDYPLSAGTHLLGRGEVDVRIEDGYASRRHAQLEVSAEQVVLTDLGSSNGTFVGDERLAANEPRGLVDGDSFRLAETVLSLTRLEASAVNDGDTKHVASAGDAAPAVPPDPETAESGEGDVGEGTSNMDASMQSASPEFDSEGTAIDPASQVEPGKEGGSPAPHSESHWELQPEDGEPISLPLGEITLGRKPDRAATVVNDSYVSGLHCRIIVAEAGVEVTDLGSTNGTFVNGARLEPQQPWPMSDGDSLRLGQTTFKVADTRPVTEGEESTLAEDSEARPGSE